MTTDPSPDPTLRAYWAIVRGHRWWVIGGALLGLTGGLAVSFTQPKQYTGTAQVLIQQSPNYTSTVGAAQPVTPTDVQTALQLVTSAPIRQAVFRRLHSAPNVTVSEVLQTNVIAISATSKSPAMAARIANAYAHAFVAYQQTAAINNLSAAEGQLRSQISSLAHQISSLHAGSSSPQASALLNQEAVLKEQLAQIAVSGATASGGVELVTPATRPTSPSSPGPVQDSLLGLGSGLLLGLAGAFLRDHLNDTLTAKEEVERLSGAPVLTMVPLVASWKKRDQVVVVSSSEPTSPATEAYRSLRTSLQFARQERELRAIVVTSPAASEGKTSTLANLGAVFAQAGERVALVSCDLRRPRIGKFFGLDEHSGMTNVLLGDKALEDVLQPVSGQKNLWVLGAGAVPHNPAELLNGPAARQVITTLRARFDLVLIDSPPVLPVTDAVVLSTIADATLIVVAASQTKGGELRRAVEKLEQVNASVVGVVFNEVTRQAGYGSYYRYSYAYKPYLPPTAKPNGATVGNGQAGSADLTHD